VNPEEEREIQQIVQQRLATETQVEEARGICRKMEEMGLRPRSVAEVLLEKGHIDKEHLAAIRQQDHSVQGRQQIAGYQLVELLGRGHMGAVYKARQLSLDRTVALKVLDPDLAQDEAYVKRFMEEAQTVARISHTNLISGIDVGEEDGIKYLVMEYADGVTLAFLLRRGGAMDEERSLGVAAQIARALDHAHKNGLIHRDVKPENIIITRDGVAKLCDLGVARLEAAGEGDEVDPQGVPDYLSPEQARGHTEVGPAADIYSLGATLFHMVTGRPVYQAKSREAVLARILTEPAPYARNVLPDLLATTDVILQRCLAKSPGDRFSDAGQLAAALDAAAREAQSARGAVTAPVAARATAAKAAGPAAPSKRPAKPKAGETPVVRRRRRRR
jgi:serine/threonine-protein kinase